ncbi:N,N-dimethylformamidase beta subunit family domain-containing protein [Conexibacter sp. CPCC 206217]|uniref:N,N-dimethylformamidase beta subunit family domain-containing protein n=1 Tax=Conexibacter sp. CPCC 206217 TaxID=3064574 RepID=UPI00271FBB1D|nr:N,N-dimethylformamidase beta subunit family domain-containing protein [Conexibacter sp. CPCC 206217]MDO8213111.1 hypothetical protein [Conexibacter sp. CPCC 206217]
MADAATTYGYCDRFEYLPGETVSVHLHATVPELRLDVVRLHSADERVPSPQGPESPVAAIASQTVQGVARAVVRGSYARVDGIAELAGARRVTVALRAMPTLPRLPDGEQRAQTLLSTLTADGSAGFALALDADGRPLLSVGGSAGDTDAGTASAGAGGADADGVAAAHAICRGPRPLTEWEWHELRCELDLDAGRATLSYRPLLPVPGDVAAGSVAGALPDGVRAAAADGTLLLAATAGAPHPREHFNGRLEDVRIDADGAAVARWDLGREPRAQRLVDVGGRGHHGMLVNGPTRAVTGSTWDGTEVDHRHVPQQYATVHFHDDDLDDVAWPADAAIELPADLASGVYALRVRGERGAEDRIPFFVLPAPGTPRPRVALMVPTFTYLAYANSQLSDRIDYEVFGLTDRDRRPSERDVQLEGAPELTGSLYDVHRDGSGRCYSSALRPILSFRPEWQSAMQHAPRHLSAELYLTNWLERLGEPYDVITDGSVHAGGVESLAPYDVVITGTHPEYVSEPQVAALEQFVARGGRLMYLGGNGFYWVTSVDRERPHVIEVRRGNAGTRTWDSRPGEVHHSTTGEPGGLWRHRGRAPNRLVGVGMASQGWDLKAPGYRRAPASFAPELAWIFDGFGEDELEFGAEGLVMDGAAGDEIDRFDVRIGSPRHGAVVASSTGHSRYYKLVHEDLPMSRDGLGGDENPDVRSDLTYVPWAGGGGVFAVGAIAWAGAMALREFDNPVARLTTNVLRRFLDPEPLPEVRA